MVFKKLLAGVFFVLGCIFPVTQSCFAQSTQIPFHDFSHFDDPGESWSIVGKVRADLNEQNEFITSRGNGIIVNQPDKKTLGKDLYTEDSYGDMDLEVDFLTARGSNSGIYFMGQYELQLKDSWGENLATSNETGGIYERWDERRPEGQKGYQGYAPRQNVSKGPGLWQHLYVSFQAPRFDKEGRKIENAKFLRVELNGVTIQEDVGLFGPTRGAMSAEERATGPIRIQGDHGAIAFRNMKITSYDKPRPELKNIKYSVYEGTFNEPPPFDSLPPEFEGPSVILSSNLKTKSDQFLVRYTGNLEVKETGKYDFNLQVPGGSGIMRINGQQVISQTNNRGEGSLRLQKGEVPFELIYSKFQDWIEPGLGLTVAGPGFREYLLSDGEGYSETPPDPILVETPVNTLLRSFMDLPVNEQSGGYRVTHSVNVGSSENLHYTYDMDYGNIVQIWRGGFLDATPMWYSRGDGSSRPMGALQHFGLPALSISKLEDPRSTWAKDTLGTGFRQLGYQLDQQDLPTFLYSIYGAQVQDQVKAMENGKGLKRTITINNPSEGLYARLAQGDKIEKTSKGLYLIGDNEYYVRVEDTGGKQPIVRKTGNKQELIIPIREQLVYSILY